MKKVFASLLLLLAGCTTDHPVTYGALGGAAAGAGIGAIVGRGSPIISVGEGTAIGAGVGIPVGIALAYASDEYAKYYILSANNSDIAENNAVILDNQYMIQAVRSQVEMESPVGLPDEDRAEYLYVGPSHGNAWR